MNTNEFMIAMEMFKQTETNNVIISFKHQETEQHEQIEILPNNIEIKEISKNVVFIIETQEDGLKHVIDCRQIHSIVEC